MENINSTVGIKEEVTSKVSQETQNEGFAPDFDEWVKEKPRRNYIRIETGQPKIIRFKSGKPNEMMMTDFGGKSAEKKPVARYLVTTPEEPNEEKSFEVTSKRLAGDIQALYEKGFAELEITKLETNPVSYRTVPFIVRQQQKQMAAPGR
jgi:hypothetical protein